MNYVYFQVKNSISIAQHYAIKNRSPITNLVQFTSLIYNNFELKRKTHSLFLDLSAAFDSIDISKLYSTLSRDFDIDYIFIFWIIKYLKNREYFVSCDSFTSVNYRPLVGIAQGSPLSALLFVLYVNPAFTLNIRSSIFRYADDFKLVNTDRSELENDFEHVLDWFISNNLNVNVSKTA